MAASSLYCGPTWLQVKKLQEEIEDAHLLIASAGFGLVRPSDPIPPYSATFSPGEDAVHERVTEGGSAVARNASWWATINSKRLGTPTPIADAAEDSTLVVSMGAPYVLAVQRDLQVLVNRFGSEALFLVCAGLRPHDLDPVLRGCLLPLGGHSQKFFKCPLITLNLHATRHLVKEVGSPLTWSQDRASRAMPGGSDAQQPKHQKRTSRSTTDTEVVEWIKARLNPSAVACTRALRQFRQSGFACEQGRFRRLYKVAAVAPSAAGSLR